jgi:hypothetical protein
VLEFHDLEDAFADLYRETSPEIRRADRQHRPP